MFNTKTLGFIITSVGEPAWCIDLVIGAGDGVRQQPGVNNSFHLHWARWRAGDRNTCNNGETAFLMINKSIYPMSVTFFKTDPYAF